MEENWLVKAIIEKTSLDKSKIEELVKKKLEQFPSLNEDAALRMVATENGIVPIQRNFKINEINRDISHVDLTGTVKKKFNTKQFNLKGSTSTLLKLIISDETGEINLVIWDTKKIEEIEKNVEEGDSIVIINAYARKNKFNDTYELNVGKSGLIKILRAKEEIKRISDITPGQKGRLNVFIVRMFTNSTFLVKCTICDKRVIDKCDIHGEKALSKILLLSGIVDDGLSSARVSFFDKVAEKLLKLIDGNSLEEKLSNLSNGLYQVELIAVSNEFNGSTSLTAKNVWLCEYNLDEDSIN